MAPGQLLTTRGQGMLPRSRQIGRSHASRQTHHEIFRQMTPEQKLAVMRALVRLFNAPKWRWASAVMWRSRGTFRFGPPCLSNLDP